VRSPSKTSGKDETVKSYSSVSGLTLLAGLGAFVGIAYVLTRKEAAASPPPKTSPPPPPPPVITFTSAPAPVQAPALIQMPVAQTVPLPTLDRTLTPQETEAVLYALAYETDPQKLMGFAASWGPSAPLTTALLMSKAQVLLGGNT
jgi:hypothetical protein